MTLKKDTLYGVLEPGLRWLFDTVQPDGAEVDPHGEWVKADGYMFSFRPSVPGTQGPPGPTVVISAVDERSAAESGHNVFTMQDVDNVWWVLDSLEHPVVNVWNGVGNPTASFKMDGSAHPSLLAAVVRGDRNAKEAKLLQGRLPGEPPFVPFVRMDRAAVDAVELLRLHAMEARGFAELRAARDELRGMRAGAGIKVVSQGSVSNGDLRRGLAGVARGLVLDYAYGPNSRDREPLSPQDRQALDELGEKFAHEALAVFYPLVGEMALRMADALSAEVSR